ncbi:MAG TPA: glycosyltransferase, partial [Lacunisphaera sp.]|nr:glycosyltransferase [Lacunisphaera sp.]
AIFNRDDEVVPGAVQAPRVWCCDALPEERSVLNDYFAPAGFTPVSEDVAVLCRIAPQASAASADATERPRTRVLIFTDDPDSGGVAQYNHSLMVGLTVAGCEVSCAQSRTENPLVEAQRQLGITHHWIPYHTGKDFAKTLDDQATARAILEAARPDLIVFSDCCPVSNMAAREVALQLGIPYVVVVGFVGSYLADRFKLVLGRLALHYAHARAVVAVSRENLDLLHNRFGLPAQKGQVIHYGRPEKFFAPPDAAVRARLRAELKLSADVVICFTAARLASIKGYLYQIMAARHLMALPGNEHLHFVWAGEGDQRGALEEAIASYGLTGRVHLLGHRWDVAAWYDAADIFVLPSDLEGMPLAIMEAMAKGLPVIATAVSGIPEELGNTGQLLPSGQKNRPALVQQLIRTLNLWANDAALRRIVGEAGRLRAEEMFRESLMIERTVSLIGQHITEPAAAISA